MYERETEGVYVCLLGACMCICVCVCLCPCVRVCIGVHICDFPKIHTHQRTHLNRQQSITPCNMLFHTVTHRRTLLHPSTHCNTATHCNTLHNTLQYTTTHYTTLQLTATHHTTPQHTATHCNTPQHTATMIKRTGIGESRLGNDSDLDLKVERSAKGVSPANVSPANESPANRDMPRFSFPTRGSSSDWICCARIPSHGAV